MIVYYRVSSILPLKIGRWYEYRVAAVNRNGTRGYSEPSKSFQLNESELTNRRWRTFTFSNCVLFPFSAKEFAESDELYH